VPVELVRFEIARATSDLITLISQPSTHALTCLNCGAGLPAPEPSTRKRARTFSPAFRSATARRLGIYIALLAIIFLFLVLMFGRG